MNAELISAGTELLLGEIVDTNAAFVSQKLAGIGVDVYYRHTVGDNLSRLTEVLRHAFQRSDVVIITGGLGPTQDDITREAIAQATSRPLVRSPEAVDRLRAFFAERGRVPTDSNFRQADVPEGGVLLNNSCGTAPGIRLEHEQGVVFALPGPPVELRPMLENEVIPYLLSALGANSERLHTRTLLLCDIGESNVADILQDIIGTQTDPTIALYASPAQVRVRMATKTADDQSAQARLAETEALIRERLGGHVWGVDEDTMEAAVGRLLRERRATLAVAESCTGGLLASRITDVAGSSDYFRGCVVAYHNEVKMHTLGVPADLLREHGAVSEQCARAMVQGARAALGADYAVATTGIAGPGGGTEEKPVGLVYVGVGDSDGTHVEQFNWPGSREQFKHRVTQIALNLLRRRIIGTV